MTGRPTKCTPELTEKICETLRDGDYLVVACGVVGITEATFHNWMNWGREGREPYSGFFDAVTRAQFEGELKHSQRARLGDGAGTSNGPSRCSQWWLERTRGKRYAPRIAQKVEEEVSVVLDVAARVLDGDNYGRLLEALNDLDADGLPRVLNTGGEAATH